MFYYTKEEALLWAEKWGIKEAVEDLMSQGFTPEEALREFDFDDFSKESDN